MPALPLPDALRRPIEALEEAGLPTWLVGRCVRELLSGQPRDLGDVSDFEAVCQGTAEAVLAALPQAVVTAPHARRLTLPCAAGPLDLIPARDEDLEALLGRRDFTLHAMAYRVRGEELKDPWQGRRDLDAGLLRAPGSAKERLGEDPLRALRALRWVAQLGLQLDPELEAALPEQGAALAALGGRRVRIELEGILLGPHAERALALLRSSGLERVLAPGVRDDAAAVVGALGPDLELRLAAWLRGARVRAVLRDLRCPRDRSVRIERLLQLHPVDAGPASSRESRARRLARRDARLRESLLALRRAEVEASGDPAERRSLERLEKLLDGLRRAQEMAAQRSSLRFSGSEVMETLGCGPGATVGRALRYLSEEVAREPAKNDADTLRRMLLEWARDEENET